MSVDTDLLSDRIGPSPSEDAGDKRPNSDRYARWALWLVLGYVAIHHILFCWFDQRLMLDHDEFHVAPFLDLYRVAETGPSGWLDVVTSMWRRPPSFFPPLAQVLLALNTSAFGLTPTVYRLTNLPWLLLLVWSCHRLVSSRAGSWAGVAAAVIVASTPVTGIMLRKYFLHLNGGVAVLAANAVFWSGWERTKRYAHGISIGSAVGTAVFLGLALMTHPIGFALGLPLMLVLVHRIALMPKARRIVAAIGAGAALYIGADTWLAPELVDYIRQHIFTQVRWFMPNGPGLMTFTPAAVREQAAFYDPWLWVWAAGATAFVFNSFRKNAWTERRVYWTLCLAAFLAFSIFMIVGGVTWTDFAIVVLMTFLFSIEETAVALRWVFRGRPGWSRGLAVAILAVVAWVGFDETQRDFVREPVAEWNTSPWTITERENLRAVWPVADPGYRLAKGAAERSPEPCRVRVSERNCRSLGTEWSCEDAVQIYDKPLPLMKWAGCSYDPDADVEWSWTTWRFLGKGREFDAAYRRAVRELASRPHRVGDGLAWGGGMAMEKNAQGLITLRVRTDVAPVLLP